jgi:DNA-binding XRE family transcriptional regulator
MKLVEIRRVRLLTTRELSQRSGVSRQTIIDIEKGRGHPALSTIRKLSETLAVDPMEVNEFRDAIRDIEPAPAIV